MTPLKTYLLVCLLIPLITLQISSNHCLYLLSAQVWPWFGLRHEIMGRNVTSR